jgi:alanine racemase
MFTSKIFENRPTRAEIYLKNIDENIKVIKRIVGKRKILGIVKANAYGHGLVEISKRLQKLKIDYLGVAYIEEAVYLRENGIKIPILVLGETDDSQLDPYLKHDVDFTGSSIEKLEKISRRAKKLKKTAKVHLKIDTGMGRIGVQWDRKEEFIKKAYTLPNLDIVGIFSHFVDSYQDPKFTTIQLKRFNEVLKYIELNYKLPPLIHLANSGAISRNLESSFFTMVRPGIMMYGYSLNRNLQKKLKPVMHFKTKVLFFKVLEKGNSVGYARTYKTKEDERIITIPVGYADGYSRDLSNKGWVYINNPKYKQSKNIFPVLGRICMDQMMVGLGTDGTAYVNDDVELWGENIKLWEVSKWSGHSMWDLLANVTERVPRRYIK